MGLEKKRQVKKSINKIKHENNDIATKQGEILEIIKTYYKELYRGEDLNVIFYQNMSNLYNQYKSVERKNSQKNPEYMLIYSLSCSCSSNLSSF